MLHKKTLIALAAAVTLGCVPVATNALAAGHQNNGHGGGGLSVGLVQESAGAVRGAQNRTYDRARARAGVMGYYGFGTRMRGGLLGHPC